MRNDEECFGVQLGISGGNEHCVDIFNGIDIRGAESEAIIGEGFKESTN